MSEKIDFTEEINCKTCKHGYFKDFDSSGYHNMCGAWNCYLCATRDGYCYDYEKGEPPLGKEPM